jgi:mannobiose 2-epimerase
MHRRNGGSNDRYWKAFIKQWEFIANHMLDAKYGGWFMETTRTGSLVGDGRKATPWKANYHTGRALMNVETMLREMEAAAGQGR